MVSRVSGSTGRCAACGNDLRAKARFCGVCGSPVAAGRAAGIGSWPIRRAFLSGDRVALIDGERRITYAESDRRTDQFARALPGFGVRQGDQVAALLFASWSQLWIDNCCVRS
jgi:AMP-binding enzyme